MTPRSRYRLGGALLLPFIAGYRLGFVSGKTMREKIALTAFFGRKTEEVRARGREFAREKIPAFVRPIARDRLDWHRARGDRILVVSASLDVYLEPFCEEEGLELLCTRLEDRGGRLSGRSSSGDCSSGEKRRRILEFLGPERDSEIFAYGDTDEDAAMLSLATHRYMHFKRVD